MEYTRKPLIQVTDLIIKKRLTPPPVPPAQQMRHDTYKVDGAAMAAGAATAATPGFRILPVFRKV